MWSAQEIIAMVKWSIPQAGKQTVQTCNKYFTGFAVYFSSRRYRTASKFVAEIHAFNTRTVHLWLVIS